MSTDLVSVLTNRRSQLLIAAREYQLVDELLKIHEPVQKPQATVPKSTSQKLVNAKPRAARKTKRVNKVSAVGVLNQVVRDNEGKRMTAKELYEAVKTRARLLGTHVEDITISTSIASRGKICGLTRLKPGLYKCEPKRSTYSPVIGRPRSSK